ncbi:lipopolysaccharide biosynthesis protein [Sphingopyxis sp. RIFCSPHIGHO2_12_FULL_65_19]|uniref:lipopolysaccharide biosynthesis protein n=1 Tax=Sphingopyxis sp. RIFCSPHIGHO2_12_FULL_65_19 TaxID=1802172 RepID=UPI0008BC8840|nr:lipopolysaccharide biosynthesis protein [Sphingopyxis sp. RIFCSPHIGHO2_12_FULL_65_19]OHD07113.1 MAG: lipopolysaccharide biosynthesis protein [Sphingopyxis sp. RIFCSPHIGHO2_12_FULL_65_19]
MVSESAEFKGIGTNEESAEAFGSRVRSAVIWRSGSQILAQIITWASTLLVIRLLEPSDYGLFAMTQVVLAFLAFLNGWGFASALVQSDSIDPFRIRQAFGLLLLLNALLAAIQFFGAPLAAAYYGQPMVADLLRVQALLFLATPFIALPEVMMSRALDFRRQAIVNLLAAFAGASTALACALAGYGVWTLVYAPIAMFWTRAIGLTFVARLLVWPSFNFKGCGQIIGFGSAVLFSQLFWLVQSQSDIFIAGARFDAHALGLYAEALFLAQIFMAKFVPPLNEVAFPAYARIKKDAAAVRWSFLKTVRILMLVAAPFYCGLAVVAGPMIETLFGAKWLGMVPYIQLISLALILMTVQILFAPVTNALGKPSISMFTAMSGAVLFPVAFLMGAQWGLIGMAWAWLIAAPLLLLVTARLSAPLIGVSLWDVARAMLPGLAPALVMAIGVGAAAVAIAPLGLAAPLRLAALVGFGATLYAALLWMLERNALTEVIRLILRRQPPVADAPVQDAI